MQPSQGIDEAVRDRSGPHENRRLPWRTHVDEPIVTPEGVEELMPTRPGDKEDGDRRLGAEACDPLSQAHAKARSRQPYRMPRSRIPMNIAISTMATAPSRTNTTAHGYMKTISMSKARKMSAMR